MVAPKSESTVRDKNATITILYIRISGYYLKKSDGVMDDFYFLAE